MGVCIEDLATTTGGRGQHTGKWQFMGVVGGDRQHLLRAQVLEVHAGPQAPELLCSQGHHPEELLSEARHRLNGVTLNGHPLLQLL